MPCHQITVAMFRVTVSLGYMEVGRRHDRVTRRSNSRSGSAGRLHRLARRTEQLRGRDGNARRDHGMRLKRDGLAVCQQAFQVEGDGLSGVGKGVLDPFSVRETAGQGRYAHVVAPRFLRVRLEQGRYLESELDQPIV